MADRTKDFQISGDTAGRKKEHFRDGIQALMDAAGIGLWEWRPDTGSFTFSPQCERILGYDDNELPRLFSTRTDLMHDDDRNMVDEKMNRFLTEVQPYYEIEYRLRRRDGRTIWVQEKATATERHPDGSPACIFGMLHDVTNIKAAEKRVEAENEHREYIQHLAGLACWEWDIANDHITFNDDYRLLLGMTPEQMNGTLVSLSAIVHPEDLEILIKGLLDYIERNEGIYTQELRAKTTAGEYIWLWNLASIVDWDAEGRPLRMKGGVLNVDERVKAEQTLRHALEQIEYYNEQLRGDIRTANRQLEESRRMSAAMFESNPHINLLFDDAFRVIDCNPAAIRYFGFPSREALLAGFLPLIRSSIPARQPDGHTSIPLMQRFADAVRLNVIEFETELLLNGRPCPFNVVMKKIPYNNSFAVIGYMIDLRSLKEAKNELQRQERMLSAANEVASLLLEVEQQDFSGILEQSLRTLGHCVDAGTASIWRNEEVDGRRYCRPTASWCAGGQEHGADDILIPYEETIPEWLGEDAKGTTVHMPTPAAERIQRLCGCDPSHSVLLSPIQVQGRFWGFLAFGIEGAEYRLGRTEERILRSSGMMIASAIIRNEMTDALVEAKNAALASTRAKSEFLSRMSHEIRTPMNAIIGMNTMAAKTDDLQKIRYYLEKTGNSSRQLLSIINDVLDMSKIEEGKFEISVHEFDFEKMLQNVINVVSVKLEEKHQNFDMDIEAKFNCRVLCDELRLSQVLINLLTNASKFTPDYGSIRLGVAEEKEGENTSFLRVEIRDSGIGISPEQQAKLFRSFEQADGGISRKFGGTGLGLAICKTIVSLMDGDIWVESELDKGARFIFRVKIGWGSEIDRTQLHGATRANLRILVVDDSQDVCEYFANVIGGFSLPCDTASNGREAIEKVRSTLDRGVPYGIVFLDWRMPGMNGGETALEIKRIMGDDIIVILISVSDWADIEREARSYGLTDFLPKPVLPSTLYETILKKTGKRRLTEPGEEAPIFCDWRQRRILLAEDIAINQEIIVTTLEATGIQIDCASDGEEAVERYRVCVGKYDMILMDVQMPRMDGLEATRTIRAIEARRGDRRTPIVAMTANAFKEDVRNCLDAGMDAHVAKPLELDNLIRILGNYLN